VEGTVMVLELDKREHLQVERFRPPYEFWPYFNLNGGGRDDCSKASHWSFAGMEDRRDEFFG
jgi:hypothetical protein